MAKCLHCVLFFGEFDYMNLFTIYNESNSVNNVHMGH